MPGSGDPAGNLVRRRGYPWNQGAFGADMLFHDVAPAVRRSMQGNKGKDTKPELAVRRLVHGMGFRYRLHKADLLGRPDIVFGPRRKVILVHGCFWHQHSDPTCAKSRLPRSRLDYWAPKFEANKARDRGNLEALRLAGYETMVVWECDLRDAVGLRRRLHGFISGAIDGADQDVRGSGGRAPDRA